MASRRALLTVAVCAAALLSGCADFGGPINGEAPLTPQEQRLQALENRFADLNRKVDNLSLASTSQDTVRLESEVRGLRGDIERLRYDVDGNEKRGRDLYVDLDKRVQALENQARAPKLTMDSSITDVPPAAPVSTPDEESTYLQVFDLLKASKYDEAITGFKGMLEKWPKGRYADNAWYWLGESYYIKREYKAALDSFKTVIERFPQSSKAPDALLKAGLAQIELKQKDRARATLQKVVKDYPNSNAAKLASQRLEQLK